MEREPPWQALQRLGVPLAGVSCRNASVLLGNGLEGGGALTGASGANRAFQPARGLPPRLP